MLKSFYKKESSRLCRRVSFAKNLGERQNVLIEYSATSGPSGVGFPKVASRIRTRRSTYLRSALSPRSIDFVCATQWNRGASRVECERPSLALECV